MNNPIQLLLLDEVYVPDDVTAGRLKHGTRHNRQIQVVDNELFAYDKLDYGVDLPLKLQIENNHSDGYKYFTRMNLDKDGNPKIDGFKTHNLRHIRDVKLKPEDYAYSSWVINRDLAVENNSHHRYFQVVDLQSLTQEQYDALAQDMLKIALQAAEKRKQEVLSAVNQTHVHAGLGDFLQDEVEDETTAYIDKVKGWRSADQKKALALTMNPIIMSFLEQSYEKAGEDGIEEAVKDAFRIPGLDTDYLVTNALR